MSSLVFTSAGWLNEHSALLLKRSGWIYDLSLRVADSFMREQTEHRCCVFRFADVEVREGDFSIIRAGKKLPVEPKAYKVLQFLVHNPGRVIPKDEILDAVWNDCEVSESSLTRSIAMLRRLLGDDVREPRYIATVPTVGYRFLAEVEVSENPPGDSAVAPTLPDPKGPPGRVPVGRPIWLAAAALIVVVAALLVWRSLPGEPRIESALQLTMTVIRNC
jgi:DNA-binding winged helix-turn-helix (wHTH) protein